MIVLDLEWNRGYDKTPLDEILQIGAVRLDRPGGRVTGTFCAFIRPRVHRRLNRTARELPEVAVSLDSDLDFSDAYHSFRRWCRGETEFAAWGADDWSKDALSYMSECNRRASIFPQCETAEALEQVEAIAAMEGVDGIFVGPCDLSIALGVPLEMDSPKLLSAIDRVLEACQRYGKQSIIFAGTPEKAREMFRKGFDSVAYSLDASMLISAVKAQAEACRG